MNVKGFCSEAMAFTVKKSKKKTKPGKVEHVPSNSNPFAPNSVKPQRIRLRLIEILDDEQLFNQFMGYCVKEMSIENMLFFVEVYIFKNSS